MSENQAATDTEEVEPTDAERIEELEKNVNVLIELVEKLSARADKTEAKTKNIDKRLAGVPSSVFSG